MGDETLETVINGEYILVDLTGAWALTFIYWDARVSTRVAEKIATATEAILREENERRRAL
jgi:hypothetical protein